VKDIRNISQGALNVSIDKVKEDNLFEKLYREKKKPHGQGGNGDRNDRNDNRGDRGDRKQRHGGKQFNRNRGHNNQHRRRDQ
jgi:hypothetical protein